MSDKTDALVESVERAMHGCYMRHDDYRLTTTLLHELAVAAVEALAAQAPASTRPVSEFVAEWRKDPARAAAIEQVRERKGPRPAADSEAVADAWQAIVTQCMVTEAVTPDPTDPYNTISRVIGYYCALAAAPTPPAVDDALVERAMRAFWEPYYESKRTGGRQPGAFATGMRAALTAALAKQAAQAGREAASG